MFSPRPCARDACGRPALAGAPSCIVHLPGAAAHVATLLRGNGGPPRLVDLDLVGASIEDRDLSGAEISGCRFTGATFAGVRFAGAQLTLSFLDRATFRDCDFSGATIMNTVLAGSNLRDCLFEDAEIVQASFLGVHAVRCRFDHSNLYGSRFVGAVLEEVSMRDCSCTRAFFDAPHRGRIDFRSSNTNEAVFQEPPG